MWRIMIYGCRWERLGSFAIYRFMESNLCFDRGILVLEIKGSSCGRILALLGSVKVDTRIIFRLSFLGILVYFFTGFMHSCPEA